MYLRKIAFHFEFCRGVLQYTTKASLRFLLLALFVAPGGSVYGQHWVQTSAPITYWSDIKCSADGTKVLASEANPGAIFLSTNSGLNWIRTSAPTTPCGSLAVSADGATIAAISGQTDSVYVSTNSGTSWTPHSPGNWQWVVCSADGTKMFANMLSTNSNSLELYRSLDSGITWTPNSVLQVGDFSTVPDMAISSDAQKAVYVSPNPGDINWFESWATTNGGASWDQIDGPLNSNSYLRIACSADASRLVLISSYLGIYTSTNLAQTWEQSSVYGDERWTAVACSADATRMIAAAGVDAADRLGGVYTSTDSGASWMLSDAPLTNYVAVAMSADGTKLFAAAGRGGIYTSQPVVPPKLNILLEQGNVVLSWNAPANAILEQIADLKTTNWMEVTNAPTLTNGLYRLVVPVISGNMFYRLKGS